MKYLENNGWQYTTKGFKRMAPGRPNTGFLGQTVSYLMPSVYRKMTHLTTVLKKKKMEAITSKRVYKNVKYILFQKGKI